MFAKRLNVFCFVIGTACALAFPRLAGADDLQTAQELAARLRDGGMKNYSIGIMYKDGQATLKGSVANRLQWARALRLAKGHPQVVTVVDQLTVSSPPGQHRNIAAASKPLGIVAAFIAPVAATDLLQQSPAALAAHLSAACQLSWQEPDRFDVELADGSKLAAATMTLHRLVLQTELGRLTVPLRLVASLKFDDAAKTATVRLRNGDVVSGTVIQIDGPTVRLSTAYAQITVKPDVIRQVSLRKTD